jgi:hypothetical protein
LNSAVMNNRFDESREMIREALEVDIPDGGRVQLHSASACSAIFRQDWTEALEHLDQVLQMVKSGAALSTPMALMSVLFAMGLPEYMDRLESLCASMRLRLSGPPDLAHGCYHMLNSAVLANRGDMAGSYLDAEKALAIARDCGQMMLLIAALCTNFWLIAAARGDWVAMETWSNESLEEDKYGQVIRNWRLHSVSAGSFALAFRRPRRAARHTGRIHAPESCRSAGGSAVSYFDRRPTRPCAARAGSGPVGVPGGAPRGRRLQGYSRHRQRQGNAVLYAAPVRPI